MAMNWTVPGVNKFVIGTERDTMAVSDWKVFIANLSTNKVNDETDNVTISEIIFDIDSPASGTISSDITAGSKIVPLSKDDGANFKAGMKVSIKTSVATEVKEVKKVSGDTLTLYTPLKGSVKADSDDDGENDVTCDQVGNTGDYAVTVDNDSLSEALIAGGNYQIQVSSDFAKLDVTSEMIHAIDYDFDNLKSDMDYLKKGMDTLTSSGLHSARIYI